MFTITKYSICFYSLLVCLIIFSACKKNSAFQFTPKPQVTIAGSDKRFADQQIHFAKDTVYVVASSITIKNGQSLLIDPGTLIKVNASIAGLYLSVEPGGTIEAKGTATEPIIFTSNTPFGRAGRFPNEGTWRGIRISGNASNPNSGILNYIRIEFAGAYSSSLLLSNVGKETLLENIQVSYSFNHQPSFEFDGGNCNASNLLSYASTGTDFLINKGYKGMLQNLLAFRHPFYAAQTPNLGGMVIQGTSTLPVISNLTVLGPDLKHGIKFEYILGGTNRRAGLITIDGAKFHIRNSVISGFPLRGYYLDGKQTAIALEKGESDISYSIIHHADSTATFYVPENAYPPYKAEDLKRFLMQLRFGNQLLLSAEQFMLTDPFNYYEGIPNPLPKAGSPLLTGADFKSADYTDPFFKKVQYRGALGTDNWLHGWTNFIPLTTDYNN